MLRRFDKIRIIICVIHAFGYLLLFNFSGKGQGIVTVSHPENMVNLVYETEYFKDSAKTFSINNFLTPGATIPFKEVEGEAVNFGMTPAFFWLKVTLRNQTNGTLYLKLGNHALTDIIFYEVLNNRVVKQFHSGNWLPFDKREIKDLEFVFPLSVLKDNTATIYLRVRHFRGTEFSLLAGSLTSIYNQAGNRNLMEGIYYGFMLLMVLYNLFIYFSLKDSSYLYYVIYIFLMGLLNATINGYAFRYFWPSAPVLTQYEDIIAALVGMAGILFASKFLNTKENVPVFHKIFMALFAGYILIIGIILSGRFTLGTITVEMLSLFLVGSFFIAAYITLNKGYRPARFFLIAWSLLLVSVIVFILQDYNILPYNTITVNALQIGSAAEALLLSMALANRINVYKKEKLQAQLETLHSSEETRKLIMEQKIMLEKKVEERTAELMKANKELISTLANLKDTQAQLVQKEKMASLGELTAGIAHEIKNPLNFVNNFAEMNSELTSELIQEIEKLPSGETKNQNLLSLLRDIEINQQKIVYHGTRADAIVKGMLQHSRASSGEKELTDINALVDEYLRLSYHGLRARNKLFNASFSTNFDETLEPISVVPQNIGRVLLNLFNNSFYSITEKKKMMDGSFDPGVIVSTKKMNDKIQITVRDNGLGIPKKIQEKIFHPFFTTKPSGEGTGLGLSLSYDIITKEHGGEMQVRTEEGEFAEFIIDLPVSNSMQPKG